MIDIPFGAVFLHGYKLGCTQKLSAGVQSFIRAFPGKPDSIDEWKKFLRLSPQSDLVNDYINNGGILHVPLKSLLFSACYLDTEEKIIPPLLPPKDSKNSNKRSHDGKLIKERTTTCNVPHSNDRGNKRSRIPVNPEDDVPEAVMNEREKRDFIKNISTLKKEMLSKQQLTKLLSDVDEKTTGNKQVLLERLQLYYSRVATADDAKAVTKSASAATAATAAGGETALTGATTAGRKRVAIAAVVEAASAATAAGGETALVVATTAGGKSAPAAVAAVGKARRSGGVKPVGRRKTASSVATPPITREEMKTAPVASNCRSGGKSLASCSRSLWKINSASKQ